MIACGFDRLLDLRFVALGDDRNEFAGGVGLKFGCGVDRLDSLGNFASADGAGHIRNGKLDGHDWLGTR
jgi:hypothetical protein